MLLALIGMLPSWRYSQSWGYTPGGFAGTVLLILIILLLLGRI